MLLILCPLGAIFVVCPDVDMMDDDYTRASRFPPSACYVCCVTWPVRPEVTHTGAGAQVDHVCFGGSPVSGKRENL